MWKFDTADRDDGYYAGFVRNMRGGCLAVRGTVEYSKNLKVLECDAGGKQYWDGDEVSLSPGSSYELCVSPKNPKQCIKDRDPVVLANCGDEDTYALNY